MSNQQGRAIGGSCLGGVLGCVFGILLGAAIGSRAHSDLPKNSPIDPGLVDSFLGFLGMIGGASVGGILGAIGGSVLGAGLATRWRNTEAAAMPDRYLPRAMEPPPSAQESSQAELDRLKARIAELEEKKRSNDPS